MSDLNALKFGYYKNWLHCFPQNVRQFFRTLKYAKQRIVKGYCDFDMIDLDRYYTNIIVATLTEFRDNTETIPIVLKGTNNQQISLDEWKAILTQIIEHFKNSNPDAENEYTKKRDDLFDEAEDLVIKHAWERGGPIYKDEAKYYDLTNKWQVASTEAGAYQVNEKDKAFHLLSRYFYNLWD